MDFDLVFTHKNFRLRCDSGFLAGDMPVENWEKLHRFITRLKEWTPAFMQTATGTFFENCKLHSASSPFMRECGK
jgi:hypothetical protein